MVTSKLIAFDLKIIFTLTAFLFEHLECSSLRSKKGARVTVSSRSGLSTPSYTNELSAPSSPTNENPRPSFRNDGTSAPSSRSNENSIPSSSDNATSSPSFRSSDNSLPSSANDGTSTPSPNQSDVDVESETNDFDNRISPTASPLIITSSSSPSIVDSPPSSPEPMTIPSRNGSSTTSARSFIIDSRYVKEKHIENMEMESQEELIGVVMLVRHGTRYPGRTLDIYKKYYEQKGYDHEIGQLTREGEEEMELLGKHIAKMYSSILNTSTYPYVTTTQLERTLKTAKAVLRGMYGSRRARRIYISFESPDTTFIAQMPRSTCPIYFEEKERVKKTAIKNRSVDPAITLLTRKLNRIFKKENNARGAKQYLTETEVFYIVDLLVSHLKIGLPMPDFANDEFMSKVVPPYIDAQWNQYSETDLQKKLLVGQLLGSVIGDLRRMLTVSKTSRSFEKKTKMYMYFGHDITLHSLLRTMGVKHQLSPDFGSSVTFLLKRKMVKVGRRRRKDSGYTLPTFQKRTCVEIWFCPNSNYRWDTLHNLTPASACGEPCLLRDFATKFGEYVPKDWALECVAKYGTKPTLKITVDLKGLTANREI